MKVSRPPLPAALLLAALVLSGPLRAQEEPQPPVEPEPPVEATDSEPADPAPEEVAAGDAADDADKAADDKDSAKTTSGKTLLKIESDLDCMVVVGLDPAVPLVAGEVLTVESKPGAIRVQAWMTAIPEARTFEDITVEAGDRARVRLKVAKALVDLRKLEARERTYRDNETRLMWPTKDNGGDLEWDEAIAFCEGLEHGGWEDWRLPTLEELESLEAMWSLRQFKTVDPITLSACCSWSSDRIDETNAWNFNYQYRRPFRGHLEYSLSLRALCVRDGSSEIPENTRKNRRLAKREAKEKRLEKLRREAEKAAAEAAAAAAAETDDGSAEVSGL